MKPNVTNKNVEEITTTKRLHLMTDPGFMEHLFLNLFIFATLLASCRSIPFLQEMTDDIYFQINDWMLSTAHRYAWWSLLGLLSSSCCALQLILNSLSLGCAGFNTWLGPVRPTFLALTLVLQASSWRVAWSRPWQWAPTSVSTLVAVILSLLPEVLAWNVATQSERRRRPREGQSTAKTITTYKPMAITQEQSFRIENVGCSACVATVSKVLDSIPEVVDYTVSIERGILTVFRKRQQQRNDDDNDDDDNDDFKSIRDKLDEAGFPMEVIIL